MAAYVTTTTNPSLIARITTSPRNNRLTAKTLRPVNVESFENGSPYSILCTKLPPMAMGKRRRHAKQAAMWVATQDLPRTAAHPFYARLNQILEQHDFDEYVEGLCQQFYADEIGRPGLPP